MMPREGRLDHLGEPFRIADRYPCPPASCDQYRRQVLQELYAASGAESSVTTIDLPLRWHPIAAPVADLNTIRNLASIH
jgi:hypothetical protein